MTTWKRLVRSILVGLLALGSSEAVVTAAQDGRPLERPANAPVPQPMISSHVLDLSASENRGVAAGNFLNFAFPLKLREPTVRIAVRSGDQRHSDLVATFDYADCTKGQESLLERPLGSLGPGDAAWVDSVEIEMIPLPQKDVPWSGGVCYGYRTPGGLWSWNLASTPLTYDAATDRVRARILVQRGPIDAIKLVFDGTVPRQYVSRVTVTTRPITTKPEK